MKKIKLRGNLENAYPEVKSLAGMKEGFVPVPLEVVPARYSIAMLDFTSREERLAAQFDEAIREDLEMDMSGVVPLTRERRR